METVREQIQKVIDDMCSNYCKWPNEWNEEEQGMELCESDTCTNCPLNRL